LKPNETSLRNTLIWDFPTRIFHWVLVIAFTAAWVTSENDRFLFHHVFAGYLLIGLLIFRLIWGMFGSRYARFRSFAYDWPSFTAYIKALITGNAARYIGHNPAGSYAIFAILVMILFVTVTGILVLGGEEGHGPLKGFVSYELGIQAKEFHEISVNLMLVLIFIHICGVVVESLYHKENLIWSMISGRKATPSSEKDVALYALIAVIMLAIITSSGIYYFHDYVVRSKERPFFAFVNDPLPDNETWKTECGDCHLAFHPVLLPARSWKRIMTEQEEHFEEALGLDNETLLEITQFLVTNASESGLTEVAHKITDSIPPGEVPLRITETAYWKSKHEEIEKKYWENELVGSNINCSACHYDAEQGWFEDSNMELPDLRQTADSQ